MPHAASETAHDQFDSMVLFRHVMLINWLFSHDDFVSFSSFVLCKAFFFQQGKTEIFFSLRPWSLQLYQLSKWSTCRLFIDSPVAVMLCKRDPRSYLNSSRKRCTGMTILLVGALKCDGSLFSMTISG